MQLGEIAKSARIEPDELRPMLMLLIKNDVVTFVEREAADGGIKKATYKLNVENIINMSLYPRYLSFLEDNVSVLARIIAETLILNGKMTAKECVHTAKDSANLEL